MVGGETTSDTAERRSGLSRGILFRSLLGAVSVVLAILPAIVALGAFIPSIPTVGRFGALVVSHLPALLVESALAAAIATLALATGGGRWTRLLVMLTSATTAAMLVVVVVTTVFAAQLNVPFDLYNMARAESTPALGDERVVFATVDGVELHADLWHPKGAAAGGGARPVVVYVHGGAFIGGVLGSRRELFEAVAESGTMVVDVEYRLSGPPRWADAPADVLCALGWVEAHAAELGVDPSKVVIAGESAGGNLAMLAGYAAGTEKLTSSCGGSPVAPRGVFAVAPTADLAGIWADFSIEAHDLPFPEAYIGGPPSQYPDRYDMASPFRLLRADLPPTYILTGANDHFVAVNRVTSVADRIREAGAEVTLVVAPFADHGFDGFPNGYGNQLQRELLPRFVAEVTE
jgi:acetyl esterase/lipase